MIIVSTDNVDLKSPPFSIVPNGDTSLEVVFGYFSVVGSYRSCGTKFTICGN